MRKLFDVGWEEARKGQAWKKIPPGFQAATR
jgi:hypothetical protein